MNKQSTAIQHHLTDEDIQKLQQFINEQGNVCKANIGTGFNEADLLYAAKLWIKQVRLIPQPEEG